MNSEKLVNPIFPDWAKVLITMLPPPGVKSLDLQGLEPGREGAYSAATTPPAQLGGLQRPLTEKR